MWNVSVRKQVLHELIIENIAFDGVLEPGKALAKAGISTVTDMIQPYTLTGEPRPYHYGYLLSFRKSKAGVPVCLYKGAVHGWT